MPATPSESMKVQLKVAYSLGTSFDIRSHLKKFMQMRYLEHPNTFAFIFAAIVLCANLSSNYQYFQ